jgi:hypothetical protein
MSSSNFRKLDFLAAVGSNSNACVGASKDGMLNAQRTGMDFSCGPMADSSSLAMGMLSAAKLALAGIFSWREA